jgi:zinc/manganese transport system ATP-binding protein
MVPLASGSVEVFGRRPRRSGARIGYLPQRRSFDPSLRIRARDVGRLGLDGARWGIPIPGLGRFSASRRAEDRRLDEVMEVVGASAYVDRPVGELSGGEQQRVLIARAIVRRPNLLLLDEPLESLDLGNQQAISGLARRICREQHVAVVMVAHDVNPVLGDLDRVLYLAGGGAVIGRPDEVIGTETLSALYNAPIEVLRASDGRLVVVGQPEAVTYHAE